MASWNQGYTITVTLGLLRCGCATSVKLRIRKGALLLIVTQKNIVNVKSQRSQQRISSIMISKEGASSLSTASQQRHQQSVICSNIYQVPHMHPILKNIPICQDLSEGFYIMTCVWYYMYFYIYLYLGATLPLKGCWQCLETFPAVTCRACGSPGTRHRGQMLPNTLQCTGHSPQQNNYLAPNVINTEVENPSMN